MKKIIATIAVLAVVLTAGLVAGYQKPAAAAYNNCPTNSICLYSNANGGGYVYVAPYNLKKCNNLPSSFNDITSSAWNRAPYSRVHLLTGYNCVGHERIIKPGVKVTDFRTWLWNDNDQISSWYYDL